MDSFVVMAVLNGLIAAAYYTIGGYLAPRFALPKLGRYAAVAFFVTCGLTHTELAVHGLQYRPAWLVSTHMFFIHGAQAVLDWGFIVVAVRYLDIDFARKPSRAARRLSESARGAALASWEWAPRSDRVRCSRAYAHIAGRDDGQWELSFDGFLAHVHPEDRATLARPLKDALARGAGGGVIGYRLLPRDENPRAVEARWEFVRARRRGARVVGVARDVTEERLAAESRAQVMRAEAKQAEAEGLAERRRRVQELSDAALKRNDLGGLLDALVDWLAGTLDVDSAAVLLRDHAHDPFLVAAAHGPAGAAEAQRVRWGAAFADRVAAEGRLVVLEEVEPPPQGPALQVVVGAPLWIEREVIGVVHVGSPSRRTFREEELELLQLAAERMALAIHQARLFEREHGIAATLQRSLLPEALPEVAGLDLSARYLPAAAGSEVGGDWYDVIELPKGEVAMVMGDVVGKGIPAAALVGKLRNTLRAYALEGHQPQQVVERLNGLVDVGNREMATLLYMVCRPTTGELTWVSAGHLPPLIRYADGRRAFLDGTQSLPLGAAPSAAFGLAHAVLEPGATVLLFTDGLIEHPGLDLQSGLERLRATPIRNGTAGNVCDSALHELLPHGTARDDVALLAVHLPGGCDALDLRLPARPDALARMRRALRSWMASERIDPELAGDIVIAAGEACANAVEHAYGPDAAHFHLEARRHGETIELAVRDSGHWRERRGSTGGRGLEIMRGLASSLDVLARDDGTLVRLTFESRDEVGA
jgi:anti-sigma regulatory factor (Ser/Thr protein kinase)/PAS domain-containing protein